MLARLAAIGKVHTLTITGINAEEQHEGPFVDALFSLLAPSVLHLKVFNLVGLPNTFPGAFGANLTNLDLGGILGPNDPEDSSPVLILIPRRLEEAARRESIFLIHRNVLNTVQVGKIPYS